MVRLTPMTEAEFQAYLEEDIQHYADEQVKAGNWEPAEALEKSRQEHQQLLAQGLASKNQYLLSIVDEQSDARVGIIYFAANTERAHPSAFIYDFLIFPEHRQRGYGAQALAALEEQVRALGLETIELHVFGHNHIAQALYRKTGYEVTGVYMRKQLQAPTR